MPKKDFPLARQITEGVLGAALPERPDLPVQKDAGELLQDAQADMTRARAVAQASEQLPEMRPSDHVPAAGQDGRRMADQAPPAGAGAPDPLDGTGSGQGYLRMRVEVRGGRATVAGVSRVDGPLVTADSVQGAYAWELVVDGQRVASDALGDLSERRSFPLPEAGRDDPRRAHHVVELTNYEFTVRVPVQGLAADAMERASVGLFRVKDASRPLAIVDPGPPLGRLHARELREVLRVPSLSPQALRPDVADTLRGMLSR